MGLIDLVKACARADKKTIILPESIDRKTWETAETILEEDIVNLIVIGTPENTTNYDRGLDVSGATVINPQTYEKTQECIDLFIGLRRSKGMTSEEAKGTIISSYTYYGCLMVKNGDTDRLVSGVCHSTTDALRPCLQIVKTKPGIKLVFALFLMVVPGCEYGMDGTLVFVNSELNQNPDPEELAAIAKSSADSSELLTQKEVRVAMSSYSTKGPAKYPDVDEVVEATGIAKGLYPELKLDGELQLDTALTPEVASSKVSGSGVAGKASVLMLPDLDVDNVGYKLVQKLAKAEAYDLVTQGITEPVNDLSRGCCADDIVGAVAITVVQTQVE